MSTRQWQRFCVTPPTGEARKIEVGAWDRHGEWDAVIRNWDPRDQGDPKAYWREYDANPPPDERTQRELDDATSLRLWRVCEGAEIVLKAIHEERKACLELLRTALWPKPRDPSDLVIIDPALNPLIDRLQEQGEQPKKDS
jgi:hypothetical protein